ncbi:MAG: ChbG/HpnK family deacetylase [Candidatus Omnitrophica bacterium]|nr:ChbG/HpnK family deacetylase [Candidatus Omnitrophota bacterium]
MRRLIVSADDFGIAKSVNEGIVKAFSEGIVTNVNIIPSGEAFQNAIESARRINLTEAGVHLALTEVRPVSGISEIPTLIPGGERFRSHYWGLFKDLFLNKINTDQIYKELKAQVSRAFDTGIRITSLSSHEHIHMMPAFLPVFIRLAVEYKIPFVRCLKKEKIVSALTPWKVFKNISVSFLGDKASDDIKRAGLFSTDNFMGLLDSGKIDEDRLSALIGTLNEGSTELVTHPGFLGPEVVDRYKFHLGCESELAALTGKKARLALEEHGVKLIKYSELVN